MGPEYLDTYPVMVVLMIAMVINFIFNPSVSVMYAISKHKYIAIINVAEALANIILSIFLVKHLGILGCAIGTAIPLIITRVIIFPAYVMKFLNLSVWKYYSNILPTILFTLFYLILYYYLAKNFLHHATYFRIMWVMILSAPVYLFIVLFVSFNKPERTIIFNLLPKGAFERILKLGKG